MCVATAVGTLIIVIVVLIATLAMLFMLFRFLRSDKGPCAPISAEDQFEVGAVAQIAGTTLDGPPIGATSGLPSAYAVTFAVPPGASSVQSATDEIPSARATLINSAEASIYETARAVVSSNAV